jgi:hypothetical protein
MGLCRPDLTNPSRGPPLGRCEPPAQRLDHYFLVDLIADLPLPEDAVTSIVPEPSCPKDASSSVVPELPCSKDASPAVVTEFPLPEDAFSVFSAPATFLPLLAGGFG